MSFQASDTKMEEMEKGGGGVAAKATFYFGLLSSNKSRTKQPSEI